MKASNCYWSFLIVTALWIITKLNEGVQIQFAESSLVIFSIFLADEVHWKA